MSEYQVIARKWRPQCFADVVGQEHVVRTLKNAVRQQRLAHAYLFVGPRGVGKTTLARIFAKAMNCIAPVDGEPCGKCASCQSIASDSCMDILEIDAASRNSAADMRELAEDVLHQPIAGKYKIYIIDEVHMLSKQAWNALLKTVEEPPAHVKFIFATTEVHQVLPTIISRCQRFDLLPIPTRLIAGRLKLIAQTEKIPMSDDALMAIARAAEGGMRDAQSLLDQIIAFFAQGSDQEISGEQVLSLFGLTDRADVEALYLAMLNNDPGSVVTIIGRLAAKGKNLETLYDDLLAALRAIQLCSILRNPGEILDESEEQLARYQKVAQAVDRNTVQILLENVAPAGRILHDALNKQIYIETIFLKAMREAHAVRLGDVLARLNQLRGAGELKFLDQLPSPEHHDTPVTLPPMSEKKTELVIPIEVPHTSAPMEEVKPAPVEEVKVAPVEEVKPAPVEEVKVAPVEEVKVAPVEEVKVAPVEEAKSAPVEDVKVAPVEEVKPAPVEEVKPAPVEDVKVAPVEDVKVAPVETVIPVVSEPMRENPASLEPSVAEMSSVKPEVETDDSEIDDPELETAWEESNSVAVPYVAPSAENQMPCDAIPAPLPVPVPGSETEPLAEEESGESTLFAPAVACPPLPAEGVSENPDAPKNLRSKHERKSIINDHPEAAMEALKKPVIHEIVDLFGGTIVDIHK